MTTRCHTHTGQGFDPFDPRAEDVRLEDIAHHLAMICRYGGACPKFYSVAEHAVRVADLVLDKTGDPLLALFGLHHDSAEAYIGDQRRPIKNLLRIGAPLATWSFEILEQRVQSAVFKALELSPPGEWTSGRWVAWADNALLIAEMQSFGMQAPEGLETGGLIAGMIEHPYSWTAAKQIFLRTHDRLMRRIQKSE